jgi:hypothetical protein
VAWVSEQEQQAVPVLGTNTAGINPTYYTANSAVAPSVNIYARLYQSNGVAVGDEFRADTGALPCANPSVAAASDGSFLVAWSGYELANVTNGWDVFARPFSTTAVGGSAVQLNAYVYNQQYAPHLSALGLDYLAVWTSMGEDGSREGVYGQFVHQDGSLVGGEFRVNTTTVSQQMHPVVASDGVSQFLTVWTSFTGLPYSFDLFAQRFINVSAILQAMSAPYVWAPFVVNNHVYQPQLVVSWAPLLGLSVTNFEVYVDDADTPSGVVTSNCWIMTADNGLTATSTHSFAVDYVTTDGRRSPLSPASSGTTWGGANYYGLPLEWMEEYYGLALGDWPTDVNAPLLAGGPSLLDVFLSGGNPADPTTWLQQQLTQTAQGMFLNWTTQPGATYQVQTTTDLTTWSNLGAARFATSTTDAINVGGGQAGYYRVVLLRP